MHTRLIHRIVIAADGDCVFDYVRTPTHWPHWHPSSLRLIGAGERPLGVGECFQEDIVAGGRAARLRWQVLACDAPSLWTARAEADNGAALELSYRVTPDAAGGVRFERELRYWLPGWWLNLLNRLVLRRRIAAESVLSLRQLKQVLERTVIGAMAHAADIPERQ